MSNPAIADYTGPVVKGKTFTVQGVALKTVFLLTILALTFGYAWNVATAGYSQAFSVVNEAGARPDEVPISPSAINLIVIGSLGGFVTALIVIFNKTLAPMLSPVYAALEGLALGGISAAFEAKHPGIVMEAVFGTFGATVSMLALYASGILRPTAKFAAFIFVALLGILALYLTDIVAGMLGTYVPVVHSNGPWGIGIQIAIVAVASLCLILDFGEISDNAELMAPKWYEWYGAFSLLVTLVWLYLEILRLLAKLKGDD